MTSSPAWALSGPSPRRPRTTTRSSTAPATTGGVGAEDLDLPSRILAVADIYDALSADRPYHEALPPEKVLGIMREESGTKLDADCVAFLEDLAANDEI
jgi:HD domain-containing protein